MKTCPECEGRGEVSDGTSNAKRDVNSEHANIIPGYHDEVRVKTCPRCMGVGSVNE